MILIGFACPVCHGNVLDTLDHCHLCNTPYDGDLACIAKAHHAAKMNMVEKVRKSGKPSTIVDAEQVAHRLAAVSYGLAGMKNIGMKMVHRFIPQLFRQVANEE